MQNKKNLTRKLTESAVMLALATVLSYVKILDLPYGGSVTLFSMLPILLVAYRFGSLWGCFTAFVYSLIQLLMGLNNLSYATSAAAAVAIVLLDYVVAFTVIGLGGIFKKAFKNQTTALGVGMAFVALLRYISHTIAGCTVWAGLSIPDSDALLYSVAYNATYMLPELIISVIGAVYVSGAVDFSSENLKRKASEKTGGISFAFKSIGLAAAAAALIADVVLVAGKLQNAETGDFDITGILNVNYITVGIITLIGAVICAGFLLASKKFAENK